MRYIIDHDFHIHSQLSSCSRDPEQSVENILAYAKKEGLKKICLTDHYWDESIEGASSWYARQNTEHVKQSLPLPTDGEVEFLFGCETEMRQDFTVGVSKERFSEFDFVVIPTTHLHMDGFTYPKDFDDTCENRAKLWVERFDALLSMDLPFEKIGIAHLTCELIKHNSFDEYLKILDLIPQNEMERLFTKAASVGCGIELNKSGIPLKDGSIETVLRPYRIAKECGCKFYLGTDAHHPDTFVGMKEAHERVISLLGLTENDKFLIK